MLDQAIALAEARKRILDRVAPVEGLSYGYEQPVPSPAPSTLQPDYNTQTVPQGVVTDADTLHDAGRNTDFRLNYSNAPELYTDKEHTVPNPKGMAASAETAKWMRDNPDAKAERTGTDYYGRAVGDYRTPKGDSLQTHLLRTGNADIRDFNSSGEVPYEYRKAHYDNLIARSNETEPSANERLVGARLNLLPEPTKPKDPKDRTIGEEFSANLKSAWEGSVKGGWYGGVSLLGAALARGESGTASDPRKQREQAKGEVFDQDKHLDWRDNISNYLQRTGDRGLNRAHDIQAANQPSETLEKVLEGNGNILKYVAGVVGQVLPSVVATAGIAAATALTGGTAAAVVGAGAAGAVGRQAVMRMGIRQIQSAVAKGAMEQGAAGAMPQMIGRSASAILNDVMALPANSAARAGILKELSKAGISRAAKRSAMAGAFAGNSTMEAGNTYSEVLNTTDKSTPGSSALTGGINGLLESWAELGLLKQIMHPAAKAVGEVGFLNLLKRTAAAAGLGAMREGSTELAQELTAVANKEFNTDSPIPIGERMLSEENRWRYAESAAAGLIFGGLFSGAGQGVHEGISALKDRKPVPETPPPAADTTTPVVEQGNENPPGIESVEPGTVGNPSVEPGTVGNPSVEPGTVGNPSVEPGTVGNPSVEPGTVGNPSVEPGTVGNPSVEPGTVGNPSVEPGTVGNPSVEPGTVGNPSVEPGTVGNPSVEPGTVGNPSVEPGTVGNPSVEPGTVGNPSVEPGTVGNPSVEPGTVGNPEAVAAGTTGVPTSSTKSTAPSPSETESASVAPAVLDVATRDPATITDPDERDGYLFGDPVKVREVQGLLANLGITTTVAAQNGKFGLSLASKGADLRGETGDVLLSPRELHNLSIVLRDRAFGDPTALAKALANLKDERVKPYDTYQEAIRATEGMSPGDYLIGMNKTGRFIVADLRNFEDYGRTKPTEASAPDLVATPGAVSPELLAAAKANEEQLLAGREPSASKKPNLPNTGKPFLEKDKKKWAKANKFIGRGSKDSSTQKYANELGSLANSGEYSADDVVFVSAEGARTGRVQPDFKEIQKALDAGATIITDRKGEVDEKGTRSGRHNLGEREVAKYLEDNGYQETDGDGVWKRKDTSAPTTSTPMGNIVNAYRNGYVLNGVKLEMRPDVLEAIGSIPSTMGNAIPTALDAIKAGVRTATTRYPAGKQDFVLKMEVGSIFNIPDPKTGVPIQARVTAPVVPVDSVDAETWSKGEGWTPASKAAVDDRGMLWIQFELVKEGKKESAPNKIVGVNIFSGSNDPLGAALTNPTHYNPRGGSATSKGKLVGKYKALDAGIDYLGKHYADVEQAYFALKDSVKNKTTLITDLIKTKLEQYPFLVADIDARGGKAFLEASVHDYQNRAPEEIKPDSISEYWTTAGQNGFIKSLIAAYDQVKAAPITSSNNPEAAKFTVAPADTDLTAPDEQQAKAITELLGELLTRVPKVLMEYVEHYAISEPSDRRAFWRASSNTLSFVHSFLAQYIANPVGRLSATLHAMAHELGHALDLGEEKAFHTGSPSWRIDPVKVSVVDGKILPQAGWAGPLMEEMYNLWIKSLSLSEEDPLRVVHCLDTYGFHNLEDLAINKSQESLVKTVREVIAQAHGIFVINPQILEQDAPQTYKFFKDIYEPTTNGQSHSRAAFSQRVHQAFRQQIARGPERGKSGTTADRSAGEGQTDPRTQDNTRRAEQQPTGEQEGVAVSHELSSLPEEVQDWIKNALSRNAARDRSSEVIVFTYELDTSSTASAGKVNDDYRESDGALDRHFYKNSAWKGYEFYEKLQPGAVIRISNGKYSDKIKITRKIQVSNLTNKSNYLETAKFAITSVATPLESKPQGKPASTRAGTGVVGGVTNNPALLEDKRQWLESVDIPPKRTGEYYGRISYTERIKLGNTIYNFFKDGSELEGGFTQDAATLERRTEKDNLGYGVKARKTYDDVRAKGLLLDIEVLKEDNDHEGAAYESQREAYEQYKNKFEKEDKPLESKRSGSGHTVESFKAELNKTLGKALANKILSRPNLTILANTTDAPFKVAPDTAGLYLPDGSVYFFASNIGPGEAFGKLIHEVGAHYGLQRMVGKETYDAILTELQRMVAAEGYASVKAAHARAKAAGTSDANIWHETLAYLAEASPKHGLIRRLITAIKLFLLSLGLPAGKLSEQDIIGLIQVAAFKEGKHEGLGTAQLASKQASTLEVRPYTRSDDRGQVTQRWGIFTPGSKAPLDFFDTATEAAASLKAERAEYEAMAAPFQNSRPLRVDVSGAIPAHDFSQPLPNRSTGKPVDPGEVARLRHAGKTQRQTDAAPTPEAQTLGKTIGPELTGKVVAQQRSQPVDAAVDDALIFLNQNFEQIIKLKQLLRQYTSLINSGLPQDRLVAAVERLYEDNTELSNQLRELTAFVSPTDLPVFDHLHKAIPLLELYGARESSISEDLEGSTISDMLYNEQARDEGVKPHDFTLVSVQYLTKTLGDVLGPLIDMAKRTPTEAAAAAARSKAARANLTDLDKAMLALTDAAVASERGVAVLELGNAEEFITGKSKNEHAKALLAAMERGKAGNAPASERNAARGLAKLRTMHDAYQMPYGTVSLSYDAKANVFKLIERITTMDPETVRLVYDHATGEHIPVMDWVSQYISDHHAKWMEHVKASKGKTLTETDFWAKHIVTFQAYDNDGNAVGKPKPFRAYDITRLGYNLAKARRDGTPATPLEAFNEGVAAMLTDADQRYVMEQSGQVLAGKAIDYSGKGDQTYGYWLERQAEAARSANIEREALELAQQADDHFAMSDTQREKLASSPMGLAERIRLFFDKYEIINGWKESYQKLIGSWLDIVEGNEAKAWSRSFDKAVKKLRSNIYQINPNNILAYTELTEGQKKQDNGFQTLDKAATKARDALFQEVNRLVGLTAPLRKLEGDREALVAQRDKAAKDNPERAALHKKVETLDKQLNALRVPNQAEIDSLLDQIVVVNDQLKDKTLTEQARKVLVAKIAGLREQLSVAKKIETKLRAVYEQGFADLAARIATLHEQYGTYDSGPRLTGLGKQLASLKSASGYTSVEDALTSLRKLLQQQAQKHAKQSESHKREDKGAAMLAHLDLTGYGDEFASETAEERADREYRAWAKSGSGEAMSTAEQADRAAWEAKQAGKAANESARAISKEANALVRPGGVFGHPKHPAHALIAKILDKLGLKHTKVMLYTTQDLKTLQDVLYRENHIAFQTFRKGMRNGRKAAVAFVGDKVLMYIDDSLTGAERDEAIAHEMGHVVFRAMLEQEAERNTPLWRRIFAEYQSVDRDEHFMEWFADEVKEWVKQDRTPSNLLEAFLHKVAKAIEAVLGVVGLGKSPSAVAAFLDGLAVRERDLEYQALVDGLHGVADYDLLTMQMTVQRSPREQLVFGLGDVDFLHPDGLAGKTVTQFKRWLAAHPRIDKYAKRFYKAGKSTGGWVNDVLTTSNAWLREQDLPSFNTLADMYDREARQGHVPLATAESIRALAAPEGDGKDGKWPGIDKDTLAQLLAKAAELSNHKRHPELLGVTAWRHMNGALPVMEVVPLYRESFEAARFRMHDGVYGAAAETGYWQMTKDLSQEDAIQVGKELLLNAPKHPVAVKLAAWTDKFFNEYVKPGLTWQETHIGTLADWGMPRYYSPDKVLENKEAFVKVLISTHEGSDWKPMSLQAANLLADQIINGNRALSFLGFDEEGHDITHDSEYVNKRDARIALPPGAPSLKSRELTLPIEAMLPFLEQDVQKVMPLYVKGMIKRVEWDKRFSMEQEMHGKDGKVYYRLLTGHYADVLREAGLYYGKLDSQRGSYIKDKLRDIQDAYLGRYGAFTTDKRVRTGMGIANAFTMWLTMPLSLLSQPTDLAGPFVLMHGDMKIALKGIREGWNAIRSKKGDLWDAALLHGLIARDFRDTYAANMYSTEWSSETAQKMTDTLFRLNGMQWFTNFNRLASFAASKMWLVSLAEGTHPDAERWLKDLDLTAKDVNKWAETFEEYKQGGSDVAYKIMLARIRFVQDSSFRPNTSQRPLFASHPYAALVWSLKQFAYTYFVQMIKPIYREALRNPRLMGKLGAVAPLLILFPLAMIGMGLRDEIKKNLGRPDEPEEEEDFLEKFGKVVSRTGILGPMQLLIDSDNMAGWGRSFTFAMAGPVVSKTEEIFKADGFMDKVLRLTPGLATLPAERRFLLNGGSY